MTTRAQTFRKHVATQIEAASFSDANSAAREAFLHGADLHGYVLEDDPPQRWECEVCGEQFDIDSMAIAMTGALTGQPLCVGNGSPNCPAYGFDLVRPALPDLPALPLPD